MKKQTTFFIGWDIVFIALLYVHCKLSVYFNEAYYKGGTVFSPICVNLIFTLLIGGLIACLVHVSNRHKLTIKSAVLELIIIGVPSFYLAANVFISIILLNYFNISTYYPFISWIAIRPFPYYIGSVLSGYEIFIFIIRMIKYKKMDNVRGQEKLEDEKSEN
ncbi:hypothetical protein [Anaerovorax odorimutans]|uniref:hypothetical protein n=1 Tax=Anaerovorax odorimutans TaxID=109327 RepID=UPI0003FEF98D|nr:hypothetical protein [Anaerovorax odorimutans]